MPVPHQARRRGPRLQVDPSLGAEFAVVHRGMTTSLLRRFDMATAMTTVRGVTPGEQGEGTITKEIEYYTSQVPSGAYLSLAVGAIGISLALQLAGRKQAADF